MFDQTVTINGEEYKTGQKYMLRLDNKIQQDGILHEFSIRSYIDKEENNNSEKLELTADEAGEAAEEVFFCLIADGYTWAFACNYRSGGMEMYRGRGETTAEWDMVVRMVEDVLKNCD